jgi:protein TonB
MFPSEARKAKIFGTVLLLVEVDENGRPIEVATRQSSGHDVLDSAALRAVRTWGFEPARLNGKEVHARLEIPVRFATS